MTSSKIFTLLLLNSSFSYGFLMSKARVNFLFLNNHCVLWVFCNAKNSSFIWLPPTLKFPLLCVDSLWSFVSRAQVAVRGKCKWIVWQWSAVVRISIAHSIRDNKKHLLQKNYTVQSVKIIITQMKLEYDGSNSTRMCLKIDLAVKFFLHIF